MLLFPRPSRPTSTPAARRQVDVGGASFTTTAIERLRPLVSAAGSLDTTDVEGWRLLRAAARPVLGVLVSGGRLPRHLVIGPADPPIVIERVLTAAWEHATRPWPYRQHRV